MTLKDLATKLDELGVKVDAHGTKFDAIDKGFDAIDKRFDAVDKRFDAVDKRFDAVDKKVEEGFKDSKIRDEELRGLMTFGLEARDVLRDEMHRRFDEAARKHDEELTLLKDVLAPSAQRARRLRLTRKR